MIEYEEGKFKDGKSHSYGKPNSKKYKLPVSDNIYCFDTESTSLFKIDGIWQKFDYSISSKEYKDIEKAAVPYIWMFGTESEVYYGRELWDFEKLLKELYDPKCLKVIWVHNLSWDFVFLMNIFYQKYEITNMCARSIKKVIEFQVPELNLIFRCSYMLTNLSLDKAAQEYTTVRKASGTVDYELERSPLTDLDEIEMNYCEMDIITLREVIRYHRNEYKHIKLIPLTSTGCVRKALRDYAGFWYLKKQQKLVPDVETYILMADAFSGGYTHGNFAFTWGRVLHCDIESEDEASAYPAVLSTEKFPCEEFYRCDPEDFYDKKNRSIYAFLMTVRLTNVKSRYYNHYLQASKCRNKRGIPLNRAVNEEGLVIDNGRIERCNWCTISCVDVDLDLIMKNYDCDIEIIDIFKAKKDYLDLKVIKFILGLYGNKTKLKGISEMAEIYRRDKARLNSCFGMACSNQAKMGCEFNDYMWTTPEITPEYLEKKLEEMKDSMSTLFAYSTGLWTTAFARKNLLSVVLSSRSMDKDSIYCDTDSIKFKNREKHQDIFLTYNLDMIERYRAVCEKYDELNISDFMPSDKDGKLHPLGFFEFDGLYSEDPVKRNGSFVTLGAKKYLGRENGELHLTLSGVNKKGVSALQDDMTKFKKGFEFDYIHSGKKAHYYREMAYHDGEIIDNLMEEFSFFDYKGNIYRNKYKWGIVLMPTSYTIGETDLIELYEDWLIERSCMK